ncbi:hypothetical protein D5E85_25825 [Vibrio parahaemolyticus]|nr:hypothetical protein D5E85_25825 [Vibrio parahaemolyticus]
MQRISVCQSRLNEGEVIEYLVFTLLIIKHHVVPDFKLCFTGGCCKLLSKSPRITDLSIVAQ